MWGVCCLCAIGMRVCIAPIKYCVHLQHMWWLITTMCVCVHMWITLHTHTQTWIGHTPTQALKVTRVPRVCGGYKSLGYIRTCVRRIIHNEHISTRLTPVYAYTNWLRPKTHYLSSYHTRVIGKGRFIGGRDQSIPPSPRTYRARRRYTRGCSPFVDPKANCASPGIDTRLRVLVEHLRCSVHRVRTRNGSCWRRPSTKIFHLFIFEWINQNGSPLHRRATIAIVVNRQVHSRLVAAGGQRTCYEQLRICSRK
jgi:hypothetical protein